MAAAALLCLGIMGCAPLSQPEGSEGATPADTARKKDKMDEKNPDITVGVFELVEVNTLEEFRKLYLAERAVYLGRDGDWEYVNLFGSDRVYKISRKTVDRDAVRNLQAERSKIKYVPSGPPFGYRRSKEYLDWLEKTKPVTD